MKVAVLKNIQEDIRGRGILKNRIQNPKPRCKTQELHKKPRTQNSAPVTLSKNEVDKNYVKIIKIILTFPLAKMLSILLEFPRARLFKHYNRGGGLGTSGPKLDCLFS